jgi:hypothetical protein
MIEKLLLVAFVILVPSWLTFLTWLFMRMRDRLEDVENEVYK